jgi:hypothetical protein
MRRMSFPALVVTGKRTKDDMCAAQEPWMFQPSIHVGWIWRYGDPHDTTASNSGLCCHWGSSQIELKIELKPPTRYYIYMIYGNWGISKGTMTITMN